MAKQQGVLADRRVLVGRHQAEPRAMRPSSVTWDSATEAQLGIAAGDELVGLGNVLALHEAWLQPFAQAQAV